MPPRVGGCEEREIGEVTLLKGCDIFETLNTFHLLRTLAGVGKNTKVQFSNI